MKIYQNKRREKDIFKMLQHSFKASTQRRQMTTYAFSLITILVLCNTLNLCISGKLTINEEDRSFNIYNSETPNIRVRFTKCARALYYTIYREFPTVILSKNTHLIILNYIPPPKYKPIKSHAFHQS